nr:hypothetical protein [uncultured Sellimonas sp.]
MKKSRVLAGLLTVVVLLAGCGKNSPDSDVESEALVSEKSQTMVQEGNNVVTSGSLPEELAKIPEDYFREADQQGTLVELDYDTYESMTYDEEREVLHKRAIVYLPYGYTEDLSYNVFYLMHGGWEDSADDRSLPDLQQ